MSVTDNSLSIPASLLNVNQIRSNAIYADVSPVPVPGQSEILYNAAAVFASIRNLFLCPKGGRSRIFQEDYFSGLYDLLQEPFDPVTAQQLSVALYQALRKWEPRVTVNPGDLNIQADSTLPGYRVSLVITVNGQPTLSQFNIPLNGAS